MGFHREISKGAKFVPRAGERGAHLSRPGPEDLETQRQRRTGALRPGGRGKVLRHRVW